MSEQIVSDDKLMQRLGVTHPIIDSCFYRCDIVSDVGTEFVNFYGEEYCGANSKYRNYQLQVPIEDWDNYYNKPDDADVSLELLNIIEQGKVKTYKTDEELLTQAYQLINQHLDKEAIMHSRAVVRILKEIGVGNKVVVAGLLHDVIEDSEMTYEELKEQFGVEIADLVNEVTHEGQKDNVGYYFPRLETKEGIMIKLADRLHNLTRIDDWPKKRQKHYLKKTKFWKSSKNDGIPK